MIDCDKKAINGVDFGQTNPMAEPPNGIVDGGPEEGKFLEDLFGGVLGWRQRFVWCTY